MSRPVKFWAGRDMRWGGVRGLSSSPRLLPSSDCSAPSSTLGLSLALRTMGREPATVHVDSYGMVLGFFEQRWPAMDSDQCYLLTPAIPPFLMDLRTTCLTIELPLAIHTAQHCFTTDSTCLQLLAGKKYALQELSAPPLCRIPSCTRTWRYVVVFRHILRNAPIHDLP